MRMQAEVTVFLLSSLAVALDVWGSRAVVVTPWHGQSECARHHFAYRSNRRWRGSCLRSSADLVTRSQDALRSAGWGGSPGDRSPPWDSAEPCSTGDPRGSERCHKPAHIRM